MKEGSNIQRIGIVALFVCLFLPTLGHSQLKPQVRHNCWDITVGGPDEKVVNQPLYCCMLVNQPQVVAESDSGLMLIAMAKEYLGTPYRYGGKTPKGFDCAGFAKYIYMKFGYHLAPYSGGQYHQGRKVESTKDLVAGDLVFFGGRKNHKLVGHTGIAIETDTATGVFTFIHSATHGGVIISRSTEPYYKVRYIGARRIFQ